MKAPERLMRNFSKNWSDFVWPRMQVGINKQKIKENVKHMVEVSVKIIE